MERQYIFFRTGRALLVFAIGTFAIVACTELLSFLVPSEYWLVASVAIILIVVVVVASFKADGVFWKGPPNH